MSNTISDPEMAESVAALSPSARAAVHEFAATISSDLEVAHQHAAAWTELSAWLLAIVIDRSRRTGVPEQLVEQLKEFVVRRADDILAEHPGPLSGDSGA